MDTHPLCTHMYHTRITYALTNALTNLLAWFTFYCNYVLTYGCVWLFTKILSKRLDISRNLTMNYIKEISAHNESRVHWRYIV